MARIRDDDFASITNNAIDFRKLFARTDIHAGLVIIVPHVAPALQRALLETLLDTLHPGEDLVNEVIEVDLEAGDIIIVRYAMPYG